MPKPMLHGVYPQATALIVLSGAMLLLDILPLVWHIKARNFSAVNLVFWIMLMNLFNVVNAAIWPNDAIVAGAWKGYVLCDIEAKLILGSWVALSGTVACIMRKLAMVMDHKCNMLSQSKARQICERILEFILCWGGTIYLMAVHYIVQSNRFIVYSISGCNPSFDNSWPSAILIFIWPPVFSLVSTYYATLLLIRIVRYRSSFDALLQHSKTTRSRFCRLSSLSLVLVIIFLPLQMFVFYVNMSYPRVAYSWRLVHGTGWNNIWTMATYGQVVFDRWISVGCGFLVFVFFGTGQEAKSMYKSWLAVLGRAFNHIYLVTPGDLCRKALGVFSWGKNNRSGLKAQEMYQHSRYTNHHCACLTSIRSSKFATRSEKSTTFMNEPPESYDEIGKDSRKDFSTSSTISMDAANHESIAMEEFYSV